MFVVSVNGLVWRIISAVGAKEKLCVCVCVCTCVCVGVCVCVCVCVWVLVGIRCLEEL